MNVDMDLIKYRSDKAYREGFNAQQPMMYRDNQNNGDTPDKGFSNGGTGVLERPPQEQFGGGGGDNGSGIGGGGGSGDGGSGANDGDPGSKDSRRIS